MKIKSFCLPVAALILIASNAAAQSTEAELREQMREAERQLAEAARQIAELSTQNLPRIMEMEKGMYDLLGKPRRWLRDRRARQE